MELKIPNDSTRINKYQFIEPICKGSMSSICKYLHKEKKEFVAIKQSRGKYSKHGQCEIDILKSIEYPNIIKYIESFAVDGVIHLVLEYTPSIDLYDFSQKTKYIEAKNLIFIMYQLLLTVEYLHSKNICHNDIKLENILLISNTDYCIKLIDFGLSHIIKDDESVKQFQGTLYYIPPEQIRKKYNKKKDIWCCGCVLYNLISDNYPFYNKNHRRITHHILNEIWTVHPDNLHYHDKRIIHLIKLMMTYNPDERLNATDLLTLDIFNDE